MTTSLQTVSKLAATLTLATLIGIGGLPLAAIAFEPGNVGLPGRREGGGTRGNCLPGQAPLVALMPDTNFGLTTSEFPTLFWYVPPQSVQTAEFILLDAEDNEVYETRIALPDSGGVIGLSLPAVNGSSPLAVDENYHWYFSLVCNPDDRSADIFTEGWIRRIEADETLSSQLAAVEEGNRFQVYVDSGIWYDALAALAEQRLNGSDSLAVQGEWADLLEAVDLGAISREPLLPCCPPGSNE
jgi:hypothetical protein